MERYEVEEDARLADLVARAARGDEVVIVRGGREIGQVRHTAPSKISEGRAIDLEALNALRARIPLWKDDPATIVRELRDDDRF